MIWNFWKVFVFEFSRVQYKTIRTNLLLFVNLFVILVNS